MSDLIDLRDRVREFTDARDWAKFHDPKSLILALMGEVGELAELFQWLPADQAAAMTTTEPLSTRVSEEVADVLIYLVRLADVLGIDLATVAHRKVESSSARYPVDGNHGVAPNKV